MRKSWSTLNLKFQKCNKINSCGTASNNNDTNKLSQSQKKYDKFYKSFHSKSRYFKFENLSTLLTHITQKKHGRVCSWEWRKRSWRNFKKKIKFQETNRLKVKVLVAHEWSWHSKHGRQGSDIGKFSSESALSFSSHYWQRMTKHNVESAIERFLVYFAIFISTQRFDFSKSQQSTTSSSRYQHWRAQTGTWR